MAKKQKDWWSILDSHSKGKRPMFGCCLSRMVLLSLAVVVLIVALASSAFADTRTLAMGPNHPTARATLCTDYSGVAGVKVTGATHEPFTLKVARLSGNRWVTVGTLHNVGDSTAVAVVNDNTCVGLKFRSIGAAITYTIYMGVT